MLAHLFLLAAVQSTTAPAASAAPVPAVSTAPAAAPAEDPKVTAIAREQYDAFASGKVDQTRYSQPIPADAVAQVHAGLTSLGAVRASRS